MISLDGDLTRGPVPRWQKKMCDLSTSLHNTSVNTSKLSISYNTTVYSAMSNSKTPNKKTSNENKKTPTNKISPGRKTPTPNKGSKTPTGDRFIPNRAATNFEIGHYMIKQEMQNGGCDNKAEGNVSPKQATRQKHLSDTLQGGDIKQHRVLAYQTKAPAAPDSHQNPLRVVYSLKTPLSAKSGSRYIPQSPERILDAPDIINDYYLNLMDWSSSNVVTVALGNCVYLWNAETGSNKELLEFDDGEHACSLSWIQDGHVLAIGTNSGSVELWDCASMKRLRVMDGHTDRVGSLAWNSYVVSSGSRDGSIIHHDVRERDHAVATLQGHTQEVCGLKWSNDLKYLASGGNDNLVNIWASASGQPYTTSDVLHSFNQHQAAVRALAWCPWQPNVLATGGGTADRCIKFWNASNGQLINSVDTKSQVCALLWSKTYKELISAHGYANNQLTIWKYPSMQKQAELTGHTSRVLQIAMSPDGSTVMSAGADETLRLWNCFAPDPNLKKKETTTIREKQSVLKQSIR